MNSLDLKNISEELIDVFIEAGRVAMEINNRGVKISIKNDQTPVTDGDLLVDKMLREKISHFTRGGWSFSSFGGCNKVKEKFEAFAHEEYNKENYKNEKHVKKCIETGEDLFGREIKKKEKIEKNFFPKDLLKLMEQNPKFYFGSSS